MGKTLKFKIKKATRKAKKKVRPNQIFQGDNLEIMRSLEGEKIDLIYIDPPFCSQSVQKSKAWGKEVSFNDSWGGGVNSYIRWLVPRLRECHRLLKETGVFCLHLDQRSSHYARVELDKIFGKSKFINEVIWRRGKCASNTKSSSFPRNHDSILIYSKTKNYSYNRQFRPYSERTLRLYKYNDNDGRGKYRRQELRTYGKNTIQKFKRQNKITKSKTGKLYFKQYLKDKPGVTVDSIWDDIGGLPYGAVKERMGYPTQKPLALLERLIVAFTNKSRIVADFFCGCGTTVSAAEKLNRKWLGCDISKDAIKVIRKRMARDHKLKIEVINTNQQTRAQIYRLTPFKFETKMVEMLGGTPNSKQVGDGGVDGRMHDSTPIQVKKSLNVGRPVIDSFYKHVKEGNGKGIIIAKSFSKTAYEEVNRLFNEQGLQIDLVPSDDIIRDAA